MKSTIMVGAPSKKETSEAARVELVTLAQIAQQLKLDPKIARRKLRKLGDKVPATIEKGRWVWKPANAAKVKALLRT